MDIYTSIAEIASIYDELNERWEGDTCSTDIYQVLWQKEYKDAYDKLKSFNLESITLKIVAEGVNINVLSRLRRLIQENLNIYEARQKDFNQVGFGQLYSLWEKELFGNKQSLLIKDRETIQAYSYPTERERELLLKENQTDMNNLANERDKLRRENSLWIGKNYYTVIYELSLSFISIIENYFPVEEKNIPESRKEVIEREETLIPINIINPDEVFRTDMFAKLLEIEKRMIEEKYLDEKLRWLPKHNNGKSDIQRLVVFLSRLMEADYFLPYKDAKIRVFFENRYNIKIGQNFERRRREKIVKDNPYTFPEILF